MKTAAIICEYDPLHNGHAYLIRKAKTDLGFDRVICIMSGNYVQRGTPAICDKYTRAGWALKAGADLVLEIPAVFSTSAATEFASCAVRIADSCGIADSLIFGVENGMDLKDLKAMASQTVPADSALLKELLKKGMTYPKALSALGGSQDHLSSNNILAVEYLRALENLGSSVTPLPVTRIGDGYSVPTPEHETYTSATAIRSLLAANAPVSSYVPSYVMPDLSRMVVPDDMSAYLSRQLLTEEDLTVFHDVSAEIAGRLSQRKNRIMTFTERIEDTKTRQYTHARISRALLHIALGIREDDFQKAKESGYVTYLRILGIRKGTPLTSLMKEKAALPIVGRTAQYEELIGKDILYDQLYYSLSGTKGEYDRSPVVLDADNV